MSDKVERARSRAFAQFSEANLLLLFFDYGYLAILRDNEQTLSPKKLVILIIRHLSSQKLMIQIIFREWREKQPLIIF